MYYVRTAAGGMMAITPKTSTIVAVKKQSSVVKQTKKTNKDSASCLK